MSYRWPITRSIVDLWFAVTFLATDYERAVFFHGLQELARTMLERAELSLAYRRERARNLEKRMRGEL